MIITQLIFFFSLLMGIFFTGRWAITYLSRAGVHLIRSPRLITYAVAFLLLPGTLLHELSHWLMAELLRVPTGKLDLLPKIDEENRVRLGSLQIAQVDPVRQTLVGLAPLVVGLGLLFFLGQHLPPLTLGIDFSGRNLTLFYVVFVVANTMFSSKKDLEVALFPALILILATVLIWRLPIAFSVPADWLLATQTLLSRLNQVLVAILALNALWLGLSLLLYRVFRQ